MAHATLDADTLALLADSLDRYRRDAYAFERRRARMATGDGFGRDAWRDYAAMGWLALPLGPEDGGFGGAPEAIAALMRYVGASLALEPVFASVVLCGSMLGRAGGDPLARESLRALAEGRAILALAHAEDAADGVDGEVAATVRDGRLHGRKLLVLHGDRADRLLVTARDAGGALGLHLVDADAPGVLRSAHRLVDGRGAADVHFEGAPARAVAAGRDAAALVREALDDARLALCSETLGAGAELNATTLAHLKSRSQFGRPIGTNQSLQHRMVELYMAEEESRAVIDAALRAPDAARGAAVAAACAQLAAFGRLAAHEAVQLHGGLGITEELAVSHYFRRLMVTGRLLGDRAAHLRRFDAARAGAGCA